MKINLIFFLSEFIAGGAGNSVFKLCKNLSKKKFNVSVVCLNHCSYKKQLEKEGIKLFEINSKKAIFSFFKIKSFLKK